MASVQLQNVTKAWGEVVVSKDINLDIHEGEFVVFVGPSGCGKSTLLRMIAGLETITSGDLFIGEKRMNDTPPAERGVGMVFQSYALYPHLSVAENMSFGLKLAGAKKEVINQRVNQVAEVLQLAHLLDRKPKALSGGQRQRVAIGRTLVAEPSVFLLDEPLSNLDAKLRESVRFEIKELQRLYQLTSIYVTHDQAEALAMSDKIVVLNAGNVEQIGQPEEIYYRPANRFVADFIGAANIDTAQVTPAEQPGYYRVRCALGEFYVFSERPPRAEHCYICWRPEDAQYVGQPQAGDNHFTLTLDKMAFMGNLTEAWGHNNAGLSVRLQLIKKPPIAPGERVCFRLTENAIHFLEPVS